MKEDIFPQTAIQSNRGSQVFLIHSSINNVATCVHRDIGVIQFSEVESKDGEASFIVTIPQQGNEITCVINELHNERFQLQIK